MGLLDAKCCSSKRTENKTVNIFLGFFLIFNYCITFNGTSYPFFYSGYLAAVPTFLVISFIVWMSANYILEVTSRAQALEYYCRASKKEASLKEELPLLEEHPRFEITNKRKFELSELCEIFFNKYVKFLYLALFLVYLFFGSWSRITVASSAWAINTPFIFGAMNVCNQEAFFHDIIPSGGCRYTYYFFTGIVGLIVITLSLLNLREQVIIQLIIGIMRFIAFGAMVIYSIVRLGEGGDACRDILQLNNTTTVPINVDMASVVAEFDPRGWLISIPVFTFLIIYQAVIPSGIHAIEQKKYLHWLIFAVSLTSMICYLAIGISLSLWFRAATQENCTLNWAIYTRPGNPMALRILSYYITLYPSIDSISGYALANVVIVNNLYLLITGQDTALPPKYRYDRVFRIFLRVITALLPVLCSFGVANLITVLKFCGLTGFVSFLFPIILQLRSIHVCKKKFLTTSIRMSEYKEAKDDDNGSPDDGSEPLTETDKSQKTSRKSYKISRVTLNSFFRSLFTKDSESVQKSYMTPYSLSIFSRPLSVEVITMMGACQFILSVISLFINVNRVSCESLAHDIELLSIPTDSV